MILHQSRKGTLHKSLVKSVYKGDDYSLQPFVVKLPWLLIDSLSELQQCLFQSATWDTGVVEIPDV